MVTKTKCNKQVQVLCSFMRTELWNSNSTAQCAAWVSEWTCAKCLGKQDRERQSQRQERHKQPRKSGAKSIPLQALTAWIPTPLASLTACSSSTISRLIFLLSKGSCLLIGGKRTEGWFLKDHFILLFQGRGNYNKNLNCKGFSS